MIARPLLGTVRSGAQDGVDVAALRAAASLELPTAGTMPLGFRTHDGPRPEYAVDYRCTEDPSPDWAPRTRANVAAADATLRLAEHQHSPGERCTANACRDLERPCFDVLMVREDRGLAPVASDREKAIAGLRLLAVQFGRPLHLNVAGNSEKTSPGIEAAAEPVLRAMLARIAAPLQVYTARLNCGDAHALNITRVSGEDAGHPFAPSWAILGPAKTAMKLADLAAAAGREDEAALIDAAAWELYEPAFVSEMQRSYRAHRAAWTGLLARERVVLTCYCAPRRGLPLRCHRRILAGLLVRCGAVDMGELPRPASRRTR